MTTALPDAVDLEKLSRALVVKLGHLGDVLLASPVLSVLKSRAPRLEVDALVYADTAPMLAEHPALAELLTIERTPAKPGVVSRLSAELALLARLRARRYDLVVALSDKPRVAWIARLSGARYAVAPERAGRPKLWRRSFTHFYPRPRGNSRHTVEVHLDALRRIGVSPGLDERCLTLVPGDAAEQRADELLASHGLRRGQFIQVHPASRWLFKCWPAARMAALINTLSERGERIALTGANEGNEAAYLREVFAHLQQPVANLTGKLTLKELAALTARARLFIGVDSAPLHIASAVRTPAVALFGPSGEVEWGPWQVPHRVVTSTHPCRPCGQSGCGNSKRSECLETLPVERVLAAVEEL